MTVRGWCPSLYEPMATGDGLLVRVKPYGGLVSAAGLEALATAARRHGNGIVELTGRASLQVRGLSAGSVGDFAAAMVAAGLASPDPAAERRRSVVVAPFADASLVAGLEAALENGTGLQELPGKFGFSIDAGRLSLPLAGEGTGDGVAQDVRLRVWPDGVEVGVDGSAVVAWVTRGDAVAAALGLARAFLALAREGQRRMRAVVAELGATTVFAATGLRVRTALPTASKPAIGAGAVVAGLPFGSADAALWASLAAWAPVRLTPFRAVVVAGDGAGLAALGLITDPADPRLLVSACPGAPLCGSASVATRALAAGLRPTQTVHVSGCEKGCAHPDPAALTLVGRDGRFDVVRHGRAGDTPVRWSLSFAEAVAP